MKIQINYGDVEKTDAIEQRVTGEIERALEHWTEQVTRVEVHLRDDKQDRRGPDDKRCTIEVRLAGRDPLTVEQRSGDLYEAIGAACDKMKTAVQRIVEKRREHRGAGG